jgi:uncharacterized protein YecT (DUF1311 family)
VIALLASSVAWVLAPECAKSVTTYEINRCEQRQFEKADRELNAQWKSSLAAMKRRDAALQDPRSTPPSYTQALISAQQAWLKYRNANCLVWSYRVRGGTAQPARDVACQISVTVERTRELRDQVKGY